MRNKQNYLNKLAANTVRVGDCIEWIGTRSNRGYGFFCVGREIMAHRSVWILFHGPIPKDMQVLHKCDNKPCVNIDHLYLGTHQDNMNDKVNRGRVSHQAGEQNGRAKLTSNDVANILHRRAEGEKYSSIAAMYDVCPGHVRKICVGEKWAHIVKR